MPHCLSGSLCVTCQLHKGNLTWHIVNSIYTIQILPCIVVMKMWGLQNKWSVVFYNSLLHTRDCRNDPSHGLKSYTIPSFLAEVLLVCFLDKILTADCCFFCSAIKMKYKTKGAFLAK